MTNGEETVFRPQYLADSTNLLGWYGILKSNKLSDRLRLDLTFDLPTVM